MSKLSQFKVGQSGRVAEVIGTDQLSRRLLEMGITRGVEISLVGSAPLGDPLELEVRGYRLSVRKGEADRVEMEPA